jgi:uncharacterized protein HemY
MSNEIASRLERIDELTTQGDLVGAWRLLEAQRTSHPSDPGVLTATGRLLRLRGRHVEARVLLEHTLQDVPDDTRAQIELAYIARDLGEAEAAHAWFERRVRARATCRRSVLRTCARARPRLVLSGLGVSAW